MSEDNFDKSHESSDGQIQMVSENYGGGEEYPHENSNSLTRMIPEKTLEEIKVSS